MAITLLGLARALALGDQARMRRERMTEIRARKGCARLDDDELMGIMLKEDAEAAAMAEQRKQEESARMSAALAAGMSAEDAGLL